MPLGFAICDDSILDVLQASVRLTMRTDTQSRSLVNKDHRTERSRIARPSKTPATPKPVVVPARAKILSIDDDPDVTRTIEMRMRPYRVETLRAMYGTQGFWLAMTEKPQLIITDIRMPQGQGDFLIQCLKGNAETRSIPVIVLTGVRDAASRNRMYHLGADAYLEKPCPFDQMLDTIREFLNLGEMEPMENPNE